MNYTWKLKQEYKALLDDETGSIKKNPHGKLRIALVFPNIYPVGMSNLGFQKVYSIFNSYDEICCERAFLPKIKGYPSPEKGDCHPIYTLESFQPINTFHIIAFSLTYELDLINIYKILSASNLISTEDKRHPLTIAGGVCVSYNPEPISDFIDAFVIGEGEEVLEELVEVLLKGNLYKENKDLITDRLAKIDHIYVPSKYNPKDPALKIKKALLKDINRYPTHTIIKTKQTEMGDMFLLEIGKGCKWGCYFCSTGYCMSPPRFYKFDTLIATIKEKNTEKKKIGLLGTAICDYPDIISLCRWLDTNDYNISLSSIRIDRLPGKLLELAVKSRQKTVSFAPETGSEELRYKINKKISNNEIISIIEKTALAGIPNFKLYFMIGLPGELPEDIENIVELVSRIKTGLLSTGKKTGNLGIITVSINIFIPKPFTPFQYHKMDKIKILSDKIKFLNKHLNKISNVRVIHDNPKNAYLQTLLSKGNRTVGSFIKLIAQRGKGWIKEININSSHPDYYVYRELEKNDPLPWGHIEM